MNTVGIIGSGNVGANIAFFLAERRIADVVLYDKQEGIAKGKSLDLMEAAPVRHFDTSVQGASSREQLLRADILCVALDAPSSDPAESFHALRGELADIAAYISKYSGVVLVASRPNEVCTTFLTQQSKLPAARIFGLGAYVDSLRLRYLVAEKLKVASEDVHAPVFGVQGPDALLAAEYISVSGMPLSTLVSEKDVQALFTTLRGADEELFAMTKEAGVYYASAAAAAEVVEAVVHDQRRPLSLCSTGSFDVQDAALSTLHVVGKDGVREKITPRAVSRLGTEIDRSAARIRSIAGAVS